MKSINAFELRRQEEGLPGNFGERLLGLKQRAGLTWEEMAWLVGVDSRQLLRWRRGSTPSGGAMLSLVRLASQVPDGIFELVGDDLKIVTSQDAQARRL